MSDGMNHYLVLKLNGVMQSWGGHTMEDLRHTEIMPTRSGILGLLSACLGIDRKDSDNLEALAQSITFAVRADMRKKLNGKPLESQRIMDFHTVMDARKVDGKMNKFPVVSRREYLCDAIFTVLLEQRENAKFTLKVIKEAIQNPVYIPFLGRRSCPITRPLYEADLTAKDFKSAFSLIDSIGGTIYSDTPLGQDDLVMRIRDTPLYKRKRQFASRKMYIHPYQETEG